MSIRTLLRRAERLVVTCPIELRALLPALESLSGTDVEANPSYLLFRGIARYQAEQEYEAYGDLRGAWESIDVGPSIKCRAALYLTDWNRSNGDLAEAQAWMGVAETLLGRCTAPDLSAEFDVVQSRMYLDQGDNDGASRALRRAEFRFAKTGLFRRAFDAASENAFHDGQSVRSFATAIASLRRKAAHWAIPRGYASRVIAEIAISATIPLTEQGALTVARRLCAAVIADPFAPRKERDAARINLSGILINLGAVDDAARVLERVVPLHEDPQFEAVRLQNEGQISFARGFWGAAWKQLETAADQFALAFESSPPRATEDQLALALIAAAEAALCADEPDQASVLANRACEVEPEPSASVVARIALVISAIVSATGGSSRVRNAWLAVALEAAQETTDRTLCAAVLINLALAAPARLRARLATRAIRLATRLPHLSGIAHRVRAELALDVRRYTRARRDFRRAAADFRRSGRFRDAADSWDSLARLSETPRSAVRYAEKAVQTGLMGLGLLDSPQERRRFRGELRPFGAYLIESLIEQRRIKKALCAVYQLKLGDSLRLRVPVRSGQDAGVLRRLHSAVAEAVRQGATTKARGTIDVGTIRRGSAVTSTKPEDLLRLWKRAVPATGAAEVNVATGDVLARIRKEWAAVEYHLADPEYGPLFLFLMHQGRIDVVERRWTRRHAEAVQETVDLIQGIRWSGNPFVLEANLRRLYGALIRPLEPFLGSVSRLVLAPGALLADVPFATLLDSERRPLFDRIELCFLLSTAQLAFLPAKPLQIRKAIVLRGSDHGGTALDHADTECQEVRSVLQGARVRLVDESLAGRGLRDVDLLHYAGHADFAARGDRGPSLYLPNYPLSSEELAQVRFRQHPLLVLSACESGRGETWGDEFGGFVRAAFAAGASAVISSSWLAHDEATSRLMRELYPALLSSGSAASALRRAALSLRQSGSDRGHPFYWANFRLYGVA